MALELEGTLRQKLGVQSGMSSRGSWTKQEFVLEYPDGNFTSQVCMLAFGQDKVQELAKYQVGDRIKVSFNLKSREYNGRWYTDIQIWRIAPAGNVASAPAAPAAPAAPVQQAPPPYQAPAPSFDDMPADDPSDDLPF
ncbi:MAG: DUF3127 domain-containing protein [Bacteroidales bacterium]|nr:DUF3127 domain-containing protein [Bacteroidales bacterium]MBP5676773.1 DUF3127 domain-containing protein [Bacteroidales bacterium]